MSGAIDYLKQAAIYANVEEQRSAGTHILMVVYDMGIVVTAKIAGKSVDRMVSWAQLEHVDTNMLICATDAALEALQRR